MKATKSSILFSLALIGITAAQASISDVEAAGGYANAPLVYRFARCTSALDRSPLIINIDASTLHNKNYSRVIRYEGNSVAESFDAETSWTESFYPEGTGENAHKGTEILWTMMDDIGHLLTLRVFQNNPYYAQGPGQAAYYGPTSGKAEMYSCNIIGTARSALVEISQTQAPAIPLRPFHPTISSKIIQALSPRELLRL